MEMYAQIIASRLSDIETALKRIADALEAQNDWMAKQSKEPQMAVEIGVPATGPRS